MADENGKNWAERWWPYLLIALLGGTGGAGVKDMVNPPRPDPFTGGDGRALEAQVKNLEIMFTERLDRMEERHLALWERVTKLPPRPLMDRVTVIEEAIKDMDRNRKLQGYPE